MEHNTKEWKDIFMNHWDEVDGPRKTPQSNEENWLRTRIATAESVLSTVSENPQYFSDKESYERKVLFVAKVLADLKVQLEELIASKVQD